MYGVASIAGVTSRNGRVSSVSSVKFYPSPGQDMTFFYPNAKSVDKIPEPISFSREENGRITSGSIKYGPSGSVSVSSSARSAYPTGSNKFSKPVMIPMRASHDFDDMFFPYPMTPFNSRSFDPWIPHDFSVREPAQPRFDTFKNGWPYPSFSPFNFW